MDPNLFIERKKDDWDRLERLLEDVEGQGFRSLSASEAHDLGRLYRRASSDLATAQAQVASEEVERYLNGLVARSFAALYQTPPLSGWNIWPFLRQTFPRLVRRTLGVHFLAMFIFCFAGLVGFVSFFLDPQAAAFFRPHHVERLEEALKKGKIGSSMPIGYAPASSSKIMTNNIRVSFLAFALGITFGLGTFLVLFYNGLILGVYAAVAHKHGFALAFWSLILPHGILELSAIFLSGGAGFLIARALLFPGLLARRDALTRRGQEAVRIIYGLIPILIVAGLIEGFFTPLTFVPPTLKIIFALLTFPLLLWYLYPKRSPTETLS